MEIGYNSEQQPSKVLLVCVYDTIVVQITNAKIYGCFHKYGNVKRILIFQKGQVSKFFIEYSNIEEASQAKTALYGVKLCDNICKMNIYFSNFSYVDLKHQMIQGIKYNQKNNAVNQPTSFTNNFEKLNHNLDNEEKIVDELINEFYLESFENLQKKRSKTDDPHELTKDIEKVKAMQIRKISSDAEDLQNSLNQSIDFLFNKKNVISNEKKSTQSEFSNCEDVLSYSLMQAIPLRNIYNLFSNFGNISMILVKKSRVYIKFRTKEFAAMAKTYLSNTIFMGNVLEFRPVLSVKQYMPKQKQYCECLYLDSTFDRFTPNRSITINPPSATLHVSSLKKDLCNEQSLRKIFKEFGWVDKVHILQHSNDRNMALIKFNSIESSFHAISELHNLMFSSYKIQISFTKSKI